MNLPRPTAWTRLWTACVATLGLASVAPAEPIWLEGEVPAAINIEAKPAGVERSQFLSDGKWLHVTIDKGDLATKLPEGGVVARYTFDVPAAGKREVWARLGFENARSPFEWRIDDGNWRPVTGEALTTDMTDLGFWTQAAWLKLTDADLPAGPHAIQFRIQATKNDKGEAERVLWALDALVVSDAALKPNGHHKPGADYRTEQDKQAAAHVFQLPPASAAGERASVSLAGTWEIARDDEALPKEVAVPIAELPKDAFWSAIQVPGDKNKLRPELTLAHRIWYRTRVNVPAELAGRSFFIDFPRNNLNTTVYVNGQLCGFFKDPFARFQIDITKAVKPGQVNEVMVGIRDVYYGYTANPDDPMKLRSRFVLPITFIGQGFQDFDYPVWNCADSGILSEPTLWASGPAYTSDVFVKPSVKDKKLNAEVTIKNPSNAAATGEIRWEAVDEKTGEVVKVFAFQPYDVAAGQEQTVSLSDDWADPKLWWPDTPNLYLLRVSLVREGQPVDISHTTFGFREWRNEGVKFTLNGVPWHIWADIGGGGGTKESWLDYYRRTNQRSMRLSTAGQGGVQNWFGLEPHRALDYLDRNGAVVRRNTTLDGEVIGYAFVENDEKIKAKQGGSNLKLALMKNWIDQNVAQVKGERNHPSIQIWTIENEFAYINLINLLGNSETMDQYEDWIQKASDAVMAVDPTRTVMIDGGGALKKNTLPTHGDHYVFDQNRTSYPNHAYEPFPEGGGRGRWRWDQKRPRFLGEDYFATGIIPAEYAMWGGEVAFQGKAQTRPAMAWVYRMLNEGYRWGGHYAAWHFWIGGEAESFGQHTSNAPRAVFTREYDSSFGSSAQLKRTFGVFNDTQYDQPITFTRTLTIGGKEAYTKTTQHKVAPGAADKFDETIALPTVDQRTEGELVLTLAVDGKQVFRDTKAVSVLPAAGAPQVGANDLVVYDPKGDVAKWLSAKKIAFTPANGLDVIPQGAKVVLVGRDAIPADKSTSTQLAALALAGTKVIVLEQEHPLKYQAIPAEMASTDTVGSTGFIEDATHPAMEGLIDKDFFTWGPDTNLYKKAYGKPARGGKSLVQAGPRLLNSVLTEVPVGDGLLLLTQLRVGEKLNDNVVAQHLLANLIDYANGYKLEFAPVTAAVDDPHLAAALDQSGLQYAKAASVLDAIKGDAKIAVVSATPANLKTLSDNLAAVKAFTDAGGHLVLNGLTPEGLADYNKLVGFEHLIRPFKRERVTFPAVRHPLTSGLTVGDIVLLSGKRIFGWTADEYVVEDMFGHVVDYDDVAPFATSSFGNYDNIVNGFVGADGWPLIIDWEIPNDGTKPNVPITLPRPETVVEYTHIASTNYHPTTKIGLTFDAGQRREFAVNGTNEPHTFPIDPPAPAKEIKLEILDWTPKPNTRDIVGIDNIHIRVQRSPEFLAGVKPMLNVGGLMHYPKGQGGIVLCNLKFQASEAVPLNAIKKRTILSTVLRNLKAPFAGGKTVIVGAAGLRYEPVDIGKQATQFRNERGWFGDKNRTLADLPTGRQTFAGVEYDIYEFPTSPVPTAIMLGGERVPNNPPDKVEGIPVNRKADALFFLHTARIDQRMNDKERKEEKRYEMAKYVVHYADGQTAEVPVIAEINIDDFKRKQVDPLPSAQVAWTKPYPGSDEHAVAYQMQWTNPRPDVEIKAIDFTYGNDKRGVPVLLALTAATAP